MSKEVAAAALYSALSVVSAFCGVRSEWTADADGMSSQAVSAYRGETLYLSCLMTRSGKTLAGCADSRFLWQTNGMGVAWWSTNATFSSGRVRATFTPGMDCGGTEYRFFFEIPLDGMNYRANGTIAFADSPSGAPTNLPLPAKSIDFASVAVLNPTNAPWMMRTNLNWMAERLAEIEGRVRALEGQQE